MRGSELAVKTCGSRSIAVVAAECDQAVGLQESPDLLSPKTAWCETSGISRAVEREVKFSVILSCLNQETWA